MESNISRDHIALDAMKIIMEKSLTRDFPLKERIKRFLTGKYSGSRLNGHGTEEIAELSYQMADAMIEEREAE